MKKITFLLLFGLFTFTSINAQISKGTWLVGGDLGINYKVIQPFGGRGFSMPLTPLVGYSFTDHFMAGGQIDFLGTLSDGKVGSRTRINPFVRYFFNPNAEGNIYFGEVSANILVDEDPIDSYSFRFGVTRFLSPSIALQGGIGYTYRTRVSFEGINKNATLGLGIQAYLNRDLMANRKSAEPGIGKGSLLIGTSAASMGYIIEFLQLEMAPNIGYFLSDQFVLGLSINADLTISLEDTYVNSSELVLNPFVRYYLPVEGRYRYFTQIGVGIGQYSRNNGDFGEYQTNLFNFNAFIGADIFVTPNLAIEMGVRFDSRYSEFVGESELAPTPNGIVNDILRGYTSGFNIGFQYFWNRSSSNE